MEIFKQENSKRVILINISLILIFVAMFFIMTIAENREYSKVFNKKIDNIIEQIIAEHPDIKEEELIRAINKESNNTEKILQKYGYDEDIVAIKELENTMQKNITQNAIFLIIFFATALSIYIIYAIIQDRKIKEINRYLRGINNGNYTLKIQDNGEGELSKLRNELYKTTILLKENAFNSEKEKEQLSNSLADISHQLKTPLTSIRIMLDNILENPEMEKDVREEFLRDISNQIEWISSLVISLLKIAKFDAGTIKMENEEINVKKLIDNVVSNLSILLEVKEVGVVTDIDENSTFVADYKWQLEALTNIVKNAIEYSNQGSKIYIKTENNAVFLKIKIQDTGKGIEKKDIKHIFERFYKTKNNHEESIGIGLSLAKTIIEQNNGYIKVDSEIGKGTTFEIKYLK